MFGARCVGLPTHRISGVWLETFSNDEIQRVSVKQITHTVSFDALNAPVQGGLYDPALGPLEPFTPCVTCGERGSACPGHIGHIVLPVPVYNPVTFPIMCNILNSLCFNCNRLRQDPVTKANYKEKLEKLGNGKSGAVGSARNKAFAAFVRAKKQVCYACKYTNPKIRRHRQLRLFLDASGSENTIKRNKRIAESTPMNKKSSSAAAANGRGDSDQDGGDSEKEEIVEAEIGNSDDDDGDDIGEEEVKEDTSSGRVLFPKEVRERLEILWNSPDAYLITGALQGIGSGPNGFEGFFISTVIVPPTKYRPLARSPDSGSSLEHASNTILRKLLEISIDYGKFLESSLGKAFINGDTMSDNLKDEATTTMSNYWMNLQNLVNVMYDNQTNAMKTEAKSLNGISGIRQVFDKKHGLFRNNMMGKRVNFAARSVISPDVNLRTDEIGIPEVFAKKLTYPTTVTAYNVEKLRQAVINGPDVYPGANFIEDQRGRSIALGKKSKKERIALSRSLLAGDGSQKVLRHLESGDVVLVNRQPTLHKPGIMAHQVRVLKGEQTIRMHYANCNTYNADFDGDEINVHFPQDELSRAEAYLIAKTSNQYLVPKDGSPLRGLIQDHVVSGVLMTKKDSFFTKEQVQEYVYIACESMGLGTHKIEYLPPAIRKPKQLWTGKQIIGSIMTNLTKGNPPLFMESKTKIPADCWGHSSALEAVVRFRNNELLHGVLDKSQFGASKYSLVHAVFELYGPPAAGTLLTCLGRVFSSFIQRQRGFTCGLDDFLLTEKIEETRSELLGESQKVGVKSSAEFAADLLPENVPIKKIPEKVIAQALRQKLGREDVVNTSQTPSAALDSKIKGVLNEVTSDIIKVALAPSSSGIVKKFPANNLALMTLSGAKGSNVNFSQISCLLGQQELEGRRVPRTQMGRTLPSFAAYDPTARAGGYITNRFLSGIRPQEYYFHCMAGREGLVDTAVKTSRSGYLQRCLIKNLENVRVHYDCTVRDDSRDGMVIQFYYGEDCIDVQNTPYLYNESQLKFLAENYSTVLKSLNPAGAMQVLDTEISKKYRKKLRKQKEKGQPLSDPAIAVLPPPMYLGSVSESFEAMVLNFVEKEESFLESRGLSKSKFEAMMWLKYLKSLVNPGEPVGILTAQSIGEPSTQMTLNTFHLAGFGGANVTLGIPRLREIIMTAASRISTPLMQIYVERPHGINSKERVEHLSHALQKVTLNDVSDGIAIREKVDLKKRTKSIFVKIYYLQKLLDKYEVSVKKLSKVVKSSLVPMLESHSAMELSNTKKRRRKVADDDDSDIEEPVLLDDEMENNGDDIDKDEKESKSEAPEEKDSDTDESDTDAEDSSDDDVDNEEEVQEKKHNNSVSNDGDLELVLGENVSLSSEKVKFFGTHFEIQLDFDLNSNCLLSMNTVEMCCNKTVIRHVPGISDCYTTLPQNPMFAESGEYAIQTDGADFKAIWQLASTRPDLAIDLNRIYTNHIYLIMQTYGIEAARNALVSEIRSVFSVYGISVDPRHLFLLADFMTSEGGFRPMSRHGIQSASSPLLKITFETSTKFLTDFLLYGEYDKVNTVSSRIFAGQPMQCGTGAFDLMQPVAI